MKGWVYVISNKAMPELVKVGFTMKAPELRAEELNHTGTPHAYVVNYAVLVEDPERHEQRTHIALKGSKEGKEWFRCTVEDAVAGIRQVVGDKALCEDYKLADQKRIDAILAQNKSEEERKKQEADKLRFEEDLRKNETDRRLQCKLKIQEREREITQIYDRMLRDKFPFVNKILQPQKYFRESHAIIAQRDAELCAMRQEFMNVYNHGVKDPDKRLSEWQEKARIRTHPIT